MTSVVEGTPVEEDSFNSTSYFDSLKLNSTQNKSWVELMEEEELEEEYSRSPWTSLAKTEGQPRSIKSEASPTKDKAWQSSGSENLGTAEVPALFDHKPSSPVLEGKPVSPEPCHKAASPVFVKQEVESDEEEPEIQTREELVEAAIVKCEVQLKQEDLNDEVKVKEEAIGTLDDQACQQSQEEQVKAPRKKQRPIKNSDRSKEQPPRSSESSQDDKKEFKSVRDPAELLFNFESARKRRHPRKNSDEGTDNSKRESRHWNSGEASKRKRSDAPQRDSSTSSSQNSLDKKRCTKPVEYEKDPAVLARRQKQIDYGKNTVGYDNYIQQVPKQSRTRQHPRTPPKYMKYSRRAWDGMVRIWRQQLHFWDPPSENTSDNFSEILKDSEKAEEDWDASSGDEKKEDSLSSMSDIEGIEDPLDFLDLDI